MRKAILLSLAGVLVVLAAQQVLALTAPASGSFAYDMYDITVNKMLKGPVGFVSGIAAIAFGAANLIQSKIMTAVPAILGGALLLKADTVVTSLGMIV